MKMQFRKAFGEEVRLFDGRDTPNGERREWMCPECGSRVYKCTGDGLVSRYYRCEADHVLAWRWGDREWCLKGIYDEKVHPVEWDGGRPFCGNRDCMYHKRIPLVDIMVIIIK